LIESPGATRAFNLTAPIPVTNQELSHVLGTPLRFNLHLARCQRWLLDSQRAIPTDLTKLGFKFNLSDAEAALRVLLRM
jgi:NAD dependent epimerase/dehydratase family enzyme